jgi:hypothetical protein
MCIDAVDWKERAVAEPDANCARRQRLRRRAAATAALELRQPWVVHLVAGTRRLARYERERAFSASRPAGASKDWSKCQETQRGKASADHRRRASASDKPSVGLFERRNGEAGNFKGLRRIPRDTAMHLRLPMHQVAARADNSFFERATQAIRRYQAATLRR